MNSKQGIKGLVTIIVPTYNREPFLKEAIDSVLAQDYGSWELIIVDDGSTDNSKAVIESYLQDSRIEYHYQDNAGQSSARNKAMAMARGEYIAFLDSDNKWFPNRLSLGVAVLDQMPNVAVAYGDIVIIDEHGNETSRDNMRRHSGRVVDRLLMDNFVSMNTTLTRKIAIDTIGNVNASIRRADDYDLWLRLSGQFNFHYIPEFMAYYRVMDDQISSNKDGRFISNEAIIRNFLSSTPNAVTLLEKRKGLGAFFSRKAAYEASMGRNFKAIADAFKSALYFPFWPRPWRVLVKIMIGRYR